MKKLYTLTLLLLGTVAAFAQTIYSENFGTPSGNPTADAYTGWQNTTAPIDYSGTASVRTTTPSTGYPGATGSGNIFFGATQFFIVEGINTSAYSTENLELSFGQYQEQGTITNPAANLTVEVSTDGTNWTPLTYTRTNNTGWELITIENGIPSTTNLRIRFTRNSTSQYRIDDLSVSNVSGNCTLDLGIEAIACGESTLGTNDTYTVTIPFTGGGSATYNINATSGTVGGDNPNTIAEGNITITGVTELTNVTVTVTGGDCNIQRTIIGVSCEPINTLPYSESFNYAIDSNVGDSQKWQSVNSGDAVVVVNDNLTYTGVQSAGNAVSFSGSGAEAFTPVTVTTTGTIYASLLFKVTDMTNVTTEGSQTVFAALTGDEASEYNVRLFYKKVGEQYQIGLASTGTTTENYTTTSYNVGETVLVILGFNYTNNTLSAWVNPTLATLNAGTPATLTETLTTLPAEHNIGGFIFRQDNDARTPSITADELRIVTSIDQLVLSAPSFNNIAGLTMYPNPLTGNVLNITSDANATKAVAIYDVLGKQVVNTVTANGTVNVEGLNAGIYIVKITEEGKTATRKLVVK